MPTISPQMVFAVCLLMFVGWTPALTQRLFDKCDADIVFVIDASSSVHEQFEAQLEFVKNLADLLVIPEKHRVALFEYSGRTMRIHKFGFDEITTNGQFLDIVTNRLPYLKGTTYTANALEEAYLMAKGRRPNVPLVVITVTDGYAADDVRPIIKKIVGLGDNIFSFATSVNEPSDHEQLLWLTDGHKERVFTQPRVLEKTKKELLFLIGCDDNRRTTQPPNTTQKPKTTRKPQTTLNTTTGTKAPEPTPIFLQQPSLTKAAIEKYGTELAHCLECAVDLVVGVDTAGRSRAISTEFRKMALKFVDRFDVRKDAARIGFLSFGDDVDKQMQMLESKESVMDAIKGSKLTPGKLMLSPMFAKAIRMFDVDQGARPPPKKGSSEKQNKQALVLMTNGYPCDDGALHAQELRDRGITVYVVTVDKDGAAADMGYLQKLTGEKSGQRRVFSLSKYDDFTSLFEREMCN